MKTEIGYFKELKGYPFGRAMQVGGYLTLALAAIHAGRVIVATIATEAPDRVGLLGWVNSTLFGLVQASPYIFLLGGLIAIAKLGKLYDEGIIFSAQNSKLIGRFGDALAWTAAAMLFIRPTLLGWIEGTSWGLDFRIDEGGMVTFVAALFVSFMAKVMQRATKLEHENQQFI